MTPQFRRLLDLVRKTGDRLVVTDPEGDDVFVLLGLDAYEALLGDNSKASPSPTPNPQPLIPPVPPRPPTPAPEPEPVPPHDIWDAMAPAGAEGDTWSAGDLTPDELLAAGFSVMPDPEGPASTQESDVLPVPSEAVLTTEEAKTPEKKEDSEEFGEEQFYLEPIE